MRAVVVVPSYNCPQFIGRCIDSIASQDHPATVVVIDDASPDPDHWEAIEQSIPLHGETGWIWSWTHQDENRGALRNIYDAVHSDLIADDDVVILVDGDDYLPRPGCVSRIMDLYRDPDVWLAWGSYRSEPHDPECPDAGPFPPEVIEARTFREYATVVNHPISFQTWLFRQLDEADFTYPDGEWLRDLYDEAIAYPLLEMAGPRHRFCDETLYVYNSANPLSVNVARVETASREGPYLRSLPPKALLESRP